MPNFRRFDQESYEEMTRVQRLKIKRTRKGRVFWTTFWLLAILASLTFAVFAYADGVWAYLADKYFDDRIKAMDSDNLTQNRPNRLNILVLGVDQRKNEPARSDTLMLAMLNLREMSADIISIPRDTRVKIEGLAHRTKINHAHANGGAELTGKTVEQLLGVPVHNYVETNFQGFENIIDIIGGVDLDVEKRMYYPAEDIDLKPGQQHLDGHDALGYVRFRSDGKGDIPRIERQHKFLTVLADQVLQPATILKLPKISAELYSNVNTDMSLQDLLVLIGEFKNINSQKIRFFNIPGKPDYIGGGSYFVVDEVKLQALIDGILNGQAAQADLPGGEAGVPQERE
ncbi:MAG: LCP family protein [Thermincola sp.]|nr:LCP family protein [Thermincola sp.]MDT3703482.1 LCP family protein [Thermincola sp.]